jgi:gluconate 2-dehydrogenase gamma chain
MKKNYVSRRQFIRGSGAAAGGSLLRLGLPAAIAFAETACSARDEAAAFRTLTDAEARELDAIAARILPTTETPGAREAGVIYFFDTVFADHFAHRLDELRTGLEAFEQGVAESYPDAGRFSALGEAGQDAYLGASEDSAFFKLVRHFTIVGFFAMSSYGGNRDNVGWKLIGFEGHGAAQPPFGYYDAEYMRGEQDGN